MRNKLFSLLFCVPIIIPFLGGCKYIQDIIDIIDPPTPVANYTLQADGLEDWWKEWGVKNVSGNMVSFVTDGWLILGGGTNDNDMMKWVNYTVEAELELLPDPAPEEKRGLYFGVGVRVQDQGRTCGGRYPNTRAIAYTSIEFRGSGIAIRGHCSTYPEADAAFHPSNPQPWPGSYGGASYHRPDSLKVKIVVEDDTLTIYAGDTKLYSGKPPMAPAGSIALIGYKGKIVAKSLTVIGIKDSDFPFEGLDLDDVIRENGYTEEVEIPLP